LAEEIGAFSFRDLPDRIGETFGPSDWVSVNQERIDRFAEATEDRQWIHVDRERAEAERGGTIAHGFLTASLLSAMRKQVFSLIDVALEINYGFDRLRFTGEVPAGARIRLHLTLTSIVPRGDGLLITCACRVEVEGSERPVLVADWLTGAMPQPAAGTEDGESSRAGEAPKVTP